MQYGKPAEEKQMKAALIGAGEESLHTIQKAQELGVYVTALDGNPEAEGLKAADEGLTIDISDEKAVLDALQDRKPDFLITGPIGRYLTTAGAVNDALGLAGISRQAAEYCTDKYLFHKKLQEKNLRNCRCLLIPAEAAPAQTGDLAGDFSTLQYPAILKPRYGSGSRGIFFLNNPRELEHALTCIFPENQDTAAPAEDYVLEEAAPGVEYGVDACMDKDRFRMILLRKKLLTPPPARQAIGYLSVNPREDETQRLLWERAAAYLTETTALLGLKNCLLHADLMITENSIFAIELSARPSGHNLHNLFTPLATGIDMAEQYIRSQCNMDYAYEPAKTEKLLIHYFNLEQCRIKTIPQASQLRLPQGITLKAWNCRITPGDYMQKVTTGHSLMGRGYFILQSAPPRPSASETTETNLINAADHILAQFETE